MKIGKDPCTEMHRSFPPRSLIMIKNISL